MARSCHHNKMVISDAAYGSASLREHVHALLLRLRCGSCRSEYKFARETATNLRSTLKQPCPPLPVQQALQISSNRSRPWDRPLGIILTRPSAAVISGTTLATAVVALFLFFSLVRTPENGAGVYTAADIELASEQINRTFSLVVPLVQNAQKDVRDEIFMHQVIPPLRESVSAANDLFRKGMKR